MSPHGPIPTPETGLYLLTRALEKVGSRYQLSLRLGLAPQDVARYLQGESSIPAKVFHDCVDILFESGAEAADKTPPPGDD